LLENGNSEETENKNVKANKPKKEFTVRTEEEAPN